MLSSDKKCNQYIMKENCCCSEIYNFKYQNTKTFLQKVTLEIIKLFHGRILLVILLMTKLLEIMKKNYENELQKINQTEFRVEKVIKKKGDKLYVKWRGYNNRFNSWIYKMSYFPEP